jgi:hypothetical protein
MAKIKLHNIREGMNEPNLQTLNKNKQKIKLWIYNNVLYIAMVCGIIAIVSWNLFR